MSNRVARNVLANFFGRGWGALLSIVLTPVYIKLLGIEAYGLVGIFMTLQAVLPILDMGLATAANREAAVLSAQEESTRKIRNLIRTLEWIYWGMAALIVMAIVFLADPIAHHWVNTQALQPAEVHAAIVLMGIVLGTQWPLSLYGGVLMGLQLQVPVNILSMIFATIRALGAVVVIKISPSVISFFQWQVLVTIVQTAVTAGYLWRQVSAEGRPPRFDLELLHQIKRFAAEMSGITLMAAAFMQLDKIVLSRVLTLEHFGYYFAASTAASGLYLVISPIFAALFPKFSQLVSQREEESIRTLYDQASQWMATAILPLTMVIVFFAQDLLLLWTQNQQMAENGAAVLGLLAIGNALNGLMNVPYALQLGSGKARQVLKINAVLILFSAPAIIVLANAMGGVGTAIAWIGYTTAFWIANTVMIWRGFSYLDRKSWIWHGHVWPAVVAFLVAAAGYGLRQASGVVGQEKILLMIVLTTVMAFLATAAVSPRIVQYAKGNK